MATPAKTLKQALEDRAPWKPPRWDDQDAAAMQALAKGTATRDQQKRALDWIVGTDHRTLRDSACGYYDISYRPGGEEGSRDSAFAEGRRFVGAQIVKLIKVKIGLTTRREE